jgi:hypothetical protein
MTILKKCYKCKELKDKSEFGNNKGSTDGLNGVCKRCRLVNPERSDEWHANVVRGLYHCSDCKEWLAITEFYSNPANKNGIHSQCKKCSYKRSRNAYLTNKNGTRDKSHEAKRKQRQASLEKYREIDRRYAASHREEKSKYDYEYYRSNPKRAQSQKAAERRRRVAMFNATGNHTEEEWQALKSYYMDQCLCCGDVPEKLSKDHVIPISRGGSDDISNIQPLCLSCNKSKQTKTTDYRL